MIRSLCFQFVYGSRDYSQWGEQLMSDIGKELQFCMIQFLCFCFFHIAQPQFVSQQNTILSRTIQIETNDKCYCHINKVSPPSCPERREHYDGQFTNITAPHSILIGSFQLKFVSAAFQIIVVSKTSFGIGILPLFFETIQAISVLI